jgi:hypothetical protein
MNNPPKEIVDLIRGSGNNFHAKVARWFDETNWNVVISPYYMDQSQGKAREIDLVAEKLWPVKDFTGAITQYVALRLIVECKFVASSAVFWFGPKDRESALDLVSAGGIFSNDFHNSSPHHYLSGGLHVAKIFTSSNTKIAESEPFYKALNQALNATVSIRNQTLLNQKRKQYQYANVRIIEFPVVICSSFDKIYAVDFFSEAEEAVQVKENFQLEVRYAYMDRSGSHRNENFLLDFVSFENIGQFVKSVEDTAQLAVEIIANE